MPAPSPPEPAGHREVHAAQYEPSDVSVRSILAFGLGLVACILLVIGLVTVIQAAATGRWPELKPATAGLADNPNGPRPPEPRLEARPGQVLEALRASEQARLPHYGWVDQQAGVVHIPIERAMELVVQRGLPARSAAEAARFQESGVPLDSSSGQSMEERSP